MEEQFLTVEQVSKILQLHPYTILKYIKEGKLKGVKLGRRYRIKKADVDKFLNSGKQEEKKIFKIKKSQDLDHYVIE